MTNDERWQAVGMIKTGLSYRAVARYFGRSHEAIRKLWMKCSSTGSVVHAGTRRNRRHTSVRADRRLIRLVRANPTMPATLLRLLWGERSRFGNMLTAQTLRRRIKETALRCRRMRRKPRLSPAHISRRERWAMQRVHWRLQQWRRVIFTDESRFRLFRADGRIRVWRAPGQELQQQHLQMTEHQGPSLHVWAGISFSGKTELVFLEGNVTANSYADLLQNHLVPFVNNEFGGPSNCILQDDNATPHRAAAVQHLKQQLGLRTLSWPSRSPDMNPIEHVWSYVKRSIQLRNPPPQNLPQLRQAMVYCWNQIPQDYLHRLILSMPRRVTSLILAHGGYTRY